MALYHLHYDIITRGKGKSAVGSALYQLRARGCDERTGYRMDYSRRKDNVHFFSMAPDFCPFPLEEKKDIIDFWNAATFAENRKDAQLARDFDIALQSEFSLEENAACVREWVEKYFSSRGLVATVAIHEPHTDREGNSNNNWHAHIMVSMRGVNSEGFNEKKDRDSNAKSFLLEIRKGWADICNAHFIRNGIAKSISEKTLKAQGIDRKPQEHRGSRDVNMERRAKNYETEIKKIKDEKKKILAEIKAAEEVENIAPTSAELEILAVQPNAWQAYCDEYVKKINSANERAQEIAVEKNIKQITAEFKKRHEAADKKFEAHKKNKPAAIMPRPGKIDSIVRDYTDFFVTQDNKKFGLKDYETYKELQQNHIEKWQEKNNSLKKDLNKCAAELRSCEEKNYSVVRKNILALGGELKARLEKAGATILQTAKEFAPVRELVAAMKKLRPQKDRELTEWQQQQKARKLTRPKPRGFTREQ